ncbi:MAG: hypothetical protein GC157_16165 [Frankiales bacterium]|nr:hypothetical protein [Frankiales bacterium]
MPDRSGSGQRLTVLVSGDCPGCGTARSVAADVARALPAVEVEVVDVDLHGVPSGLAFVGTPTYVLDDRVVSLGNPRAEDLVTLIDGARR